jgi:PKD repeat protein
LASFSVSASPTAGQAVTFTDTSSDPDGSIAGRAWDTDNDGQFDNGTGPSAQATFAAAGTYTVRLRVTDNQGAQAIATTQVVVQSAGGGGGGVTIPAGNLTLNPSFEAGTTKWGCFHCALTAAGLADAPHGTQVGLITLGAGFTSMALDDSPDSIASTTAGASYTATAYVKAANAGSVGKSAKIYLREWDAAGAVVKDTGSTAVTLGNAFTPITITAAALAGGHKMDVRVSLSPAVAGNALYVDAVSVVRN